MDIILCMHLTINLIEITENIKFWCLQFLMQTIKLKHHEIGNVLFSAMHRSSFIKMALVFCLTLHYWPAVHKRMRLQSLNDIVCAWKNKLKQKIRETGTLWKLGQDFYDLSQIGWILSPCSSLLQMIRSAINHQRWCHVQDLDKIKLNEPKGAL